MSELEISELQSKCLNKILKENINKLRDKEIQNKIGYKLFNMDYEIILSINNISKITEIIEKSIEIENYKKAFRYLFLLNRTIDNLIRDI